MQLWLPVQGLSENQVWHWPLNPSVLPPSPPRCWDFRCVILTGPGVGFSLLCLLRHYLYFKKFIEAWLMGSQLCLSRLCNKRSAPSSSHLFSSSFEFFLLFPLSKLVGVCFLLVTAFPGHFSKSFDFQPHSPSPGHQNKQWNSPRLQKPPPTEESIQHSIGPSKTLRVSVCFLSDPTLTAWLIYH